MDKIPHCNINLPDCTKRYELVAIDGNPVTEYVCWDCLAAILVTEYMKDAS